ncbi:hypothetical protein CDL12_26022 [Handroanthus impetiginosus]|uniref:Uncharacterized protein n=1 Tax=Handroanthus impetiginosus TaxID=429701 RepID=A0A2G9G854_9LAMI|nr:hypothetical protein CDL12_26022 [Handroanthus impetiginosus]
MRLKQKVQRLPRKQPIRVSPLPPVLEHSTSAPQCSTHRAGLHTRSCIGVGHTVLPLPDSALHGHLTFVRDSKRARYEALYSKPIIPCKYVHFPTLETLCIHREVNELIDGIGWRTYFNIRCPAYIELVREFYATFVFDKPADFSLHSPNVIRFSHCDFSADFEPISFYRSLAQNPSIRYNPSTSKDTYIIYPALKYVHRFLSFLFSGRKDSASVLSKAEFFFLWCMNRSVKAFDLGSLITHLVVQLNLISLDANDLHLACEMQPLDMTCLLGMGLVGQRNGEFYFCPPGPLIPRKARVVIDRGATSSNSPNTTSSSDEDMARSTTARLR